MKNSEDQGDDFYAHGYGLGSKSEIKTMLDEHRTEGATTPSSLGDEAKRLKTLKLMEYMF